MLSTSCSLGLISVHLSKVFESGLTLEDNAKNRRCGSRGGSRQGCGRKPGEKTRPVRLPEWLLDALAEIDEPRHCIVKACVEQYGIEPPLKKESYD